METADAVVIGGGVIGASVAYRLAQQGRKTVLIEKGSMASGASGACDKAVFLQSKKAGFHMQLARASMEIYENLQEELEVPFEFQKGGGMVVIENEQHRPMIRDLVRRQQAEGFQVRLLDGKEARTIQPEVAPEVTGASWSEEDAEVNPLLLTHAFRLASQRLGVKIRTGTEVIDLVTRSGKVTEVVTNKGKIATEVVVNAAGAYAGRVGKMAGVAVPVSPRRGMILISEKLPPVIRGNVLCTQYIFLKHKMTEDLNNKYNIGLSLGQTLSGNLLIGGSREFAGFTRTIEPGMIAAIAAHAARLFPFLKNVRIIRTMIGFRPYTGDGLPIISEVPGIEGFFIAAGHEGDGIALSPVSGMIAANLIEKTGPYLHFAERLKLDRFNTA